MCGSSYTLYLYSVRGYTCLYTLINKPVVISVHAHSLHDALPISNGAWNAQRHAKRMSPEQDSLRGPFFSTGGLKSTRTNSSHLRVSYAVSCAHKQRIARSPSGKDATNFSPNSLL